MNFLLAAGASALLLVPSPGADRWEDRRGLVSEWSGGPSFLVIGTRGRSPTEHLGYTVIFGAHLMRRISREPAHEKTGEIFGESEAMRWCMPVACGALGLLFAPSGSLVGNELGFDVEVTGANDLGRIGLRPVLRYSHGKFRTPSLLGIFTPSVALTRADTEDGVRNFFVVGWSLFPFDWRISDSLALGFDPLRAGAMVDLAGGRGRSEISSSFVIRFAP